MLDILHEQDVKARIKWSNLKHTPVLMEYQFINHTSNFTRFFFLWNCFLYNSDRHKTNATQENLAAIIKSQYPTPSELTNFVQ
jgi:hypothetical protein